MTNESDIQFATDAIRKYLAMRPDSADTIKGIHQWWINWPNNPPDNIQITQSALEILVESGEMESRKIGSRLIWRRRR